MTPSLGDLMVINLTIASFRTPMDFTFRRLGERVFSRENSQGGEKDATAKRFNIWRKMNRPWGLSLSNDWSFRNLISALPIVIRRSRVGPLAHPASMAYLALKGWMGSDVPLRGVPTRASVSVRSDVHLELCLAEHPKIRGPLLTHLHPKKEWITMLLSTIFPSLCSSRKFSASKKKAWYSGLLK